MRAEFRHVELPGDHATSESKQYGGPRRWEMPLRPPNLMLRFLSALCCYPSLLLQAISLPSCLATRFTPAIETISSPYPFPSSLSILALPHILASQPDLRQCKLHSSALRFARTPSILASGEPHGQNVVIQLVIRTSRGPFSQRHSTLADDNARVFVVRHPTNHQTSL
jgi:hypothetical protein